jgi:hypothetical protein
LIESEVHWHYLVPGMDAYSGPLNRAPPPIQPIVDHINFISEEHAQILSNLPPHAAEAVQTYW